MEYHNLDLTLTWHKETSEVSVACKDGVENIPSNGPVKYLPEKVVDPGLPIVVDISEIITGGQHIADLLIPKGDIRKRFKDLWQHEAIRLRLSYAGDDESIRKLMEIPWECAYLSKTKDEEPDNTIKRDYLLGLREDISIVHCLNPDPSSRRLSSVERPSVEMKYFSYLGEDKNADNVIFQNFLEEFEKLKSFINCSNVSNPNAFRLEANPDVLPEADDVRIALQKDHIIHLTTHGEPGAITMADGELTIRGLLNPFKFINELNIKAVLFLSCSSGDWHSVAKALHEVGVPVVIGMTRKIQLDAAGDFVDGFYKALAAWPNAGLENAIVHGRQGIFEERHSEEKWYIGFCLPRLFLNCSDSILIGEHLLFGSDEMVKSFDYYIRDTLAKVKKRKSISTSNSVDCQKKLNEWIHEGLTRWFFISGVSGSGKSTQIAQFVNDYMLGLPLLRANAQDDQSDEISQCIMKLKQTQKPKLIYHFCRPDQPETGDPLTFVQSSLVPQLVFHFGLQYYEWCRPSGKFPLLTNNARDALIDFVYTPLSKAKELDPEPPVIVIDGLDFIPPDHGFDSSILGLLYDHRDKLDTVARFIVTTDAVENGNERTKQIRETVAQLTHQIVPIDISPPVLSANEVARLKLKLFKNVMDVKLSNVLEKQPAPTPAFEEMAKRSISLFSRKSYSTKGNILSLEDWASPQGLDKLYDYALAIVKEQYQENWWKNKAQQFLDVIALTYEPLLLCDIAAIINAKDDEVNELFEMFQLFLKDRRKQTPLKFFHHSLRDYLRRDIQCRNCNVFTHNLFVEAFLPPEVLHPTNARPDWANLYGTKWQERRALHKCKNRPSQQNNSLTPTSYARLYLSYHLYERYKGDAKDGRRERAKEFLKLICEPDFRIVRLAEVGRDAVVREIKNGLRVVYTEYALPSSGANDELDNPAVRAIDRIMVADEFNLQCLEQQLRNGQAGVPALFEFLGLDKKLWEA